MSKFNKEQKIEIYRKWKDEKISISQLSKAYKMNIEERPKEINKRNEFGHYTSVKLLLLITHFYLFICLLFHSKSDHHYYETKSKSNHIDQPT